MNFEPIDNNNKKWFCCDIVLPDDMLCLFTLQGFVTGLGKGVIGTVTKPVVGVLDLASGAANAIKDTSSSCSRISPPPVRLPRCCHGAGMLLPAYSKNQAKSQKLLHDLNKKNLDEL